MKIWKIALVLGLIAGISGLLIAGVNYFTEDRISENEVAKKNELVEDFYPDANVENLEWVTVDEKYTQVQEKAEIFDGTDLIGTVYVASGTNAYGDISLGVAISAENEIIGLQYLSLNQTPGFGDKVNVDSYKGQYLGQIVPDVHVDAVSGATYSSNLVSSIVMEVGMAHMGLDIAEDEPTEVPIYWFVILGLLLIGGPIVIWKVGGKNETK